MDRQPSWVNGTSLAALSKRPHICYAFGRNDFGQSGAPSPEQRDVVVPARAIDDLKKVVCVAGQAGHSAFVTGVSASARSLPLRTETVEECIDIIYTSPCLHAHSMCRWTRNQRVTNTST